MNLKDKLKTARRPERVVPVCLRGDLVADFDVAKREQAAMGAASKPDSLNAGTRRRELQERMEAICAEMRESTVDLRLRALPRTRYSQLVAKFPPRENNARDMLVGANEDEIVAALIREGIVDPEVDDADWAALEEALTESQYQELANAAWDLNKAPVSVPFLPPGLQSPSTSATG